MEVSSQVTKENTAFPVNGEAQREGETDMTDKECIFCKIAGQSAAAALRENAASKSL